MDKINVLEETATLWRDNSESALELQKKLEDKGYNLLIKFTGSSRPIFSYCSGFLMGYRNIQCFIG